MGPTRRTSLLWKIRNSMSLMQPRNSCKIRLLLYVAALLARRLDRANETAIALKRQLDAGEPRMLIRSTINQIASVLRERLQRIPLHSKL